MKSNSFKLSVGLVGFLRHETSPSCGLTRTLVGSPENASEPDLKPDRKSDQSAADQALALLNRLRTLTLPAGRMPAAREIAQRCADQLVLWENGEPVDEADAPASVLVVLRDIERELMALGGVPDPKLAEAVAMVESAFPGARLVDFRSRPQ